MIQNNKTLVDKINEQIKSNEVKMKPKAYFIAGSVILGIGIAAAITVTLFFIGVMAFRLRVHAPFDYLKFGSGGFAPFVHNLPWIPFLIAIVGIVAGLFLIKRFNIGYHHAFIGIIVGFIATLTIFGLVIDVAGLPEKVQDVKPFQPFFQNKFHGKGWVAGLVIETDENELIVLQPDGMEVLILINKNTLINPPKDITVGEIVRALGDVCDDGFVAEAIRHGELPRGGPFNINKLPHGVKRKCLGPGCLQ